MIAILALFTTLALVAAGLTGWLIAARGQGRMRTAFAAELSASEQRAVTAEARVLDYAARTQQQALELAAERETQAQLREEVREAQTALAAVQNATASSQLEAKRAERQLQQALADQSALKAQVTSLREQLAKDTENGRARDGRAVEQVQKLLAPLIERERLGNELARLEVGRGTRGELPRLMDAIAKIGNFSTVVLSDEVGLPLATNQGGPDSELIAGVWSLLLSIADRVAVSGKPVPTAVLVHDAENHMTVHRLFSSAGGRYLLTATGRTGSLAPEALDPALDKLQRILAGSALAAS